MSELLYKNIFDIWTWFTGFIKSVVAYADADGMLMTPKVSL